MENTIFDAKGLAKYLNASEWLVYTKAKTGDIPSFRVGGKVLFRKETIDAWIAGQEEKSVRGQ